MIKIQEDNKEWKNSIQLVAMFLDDLESYFAPTLVSSLDRNLPEKGIPSYADKMKFISSLYSKITSLTENEIAEYNREIYGFETVKKCQK